MSIQISDILKDMKMLTKFTILLDTCTSLSKELCLKTSEGDIVDYIFHFLQSSNQSQPSIEAREPAIHVLINLLRFHETSWYIWTVSNKKKYSNNEIYFYHLH